MALPHPPGRGARVQVTRTTSARYVLILLMLIVIGGIGGVVAIHSRVPGAPKACCAQWQRSTLTGETDALLADPHTPARLFAGSPTGLWISNDTGMTWSHARGWAGHIAVQSLAAASASHTIFVGANDGSVYTGSSSGTGDWLRISPPLSASPVFCLAYNPHLRVLLAGMVDGLYRGEQRGTGWRWRKVAATEDSAVTAIAWTPWDSARGYASVFGVQPPLLRTDDGGRTWHADARGLPSTLPTQSLLALTSQGQQVWLSTMGGGVWRRATDGTWHDESSGLPAHHAMPLVASLGGTLYAGTMGYGVYTKQGPEAWRRVGRELIGSQYIILSLAWVDQKRSILVAGTSRGVYRYTFPS